MLHKLNYQYYVQLAYLVADFRYKIIRTEKYNYAVCS